MKHFATTLLRLESIEVRAGAVGHSVEAGRPKVRQKFFQTRTTVHPNPSAATEVNPPRHLVKCEGAGLEAGSRWGIYSSMGPGGVRLRRLAVRLGALKG